MKTINKILKTGIKTSKKFLKTVGWLSIITGTLAIANYERTHSNLEITPNPDSTYTYKHEDDRTSHLLNILGGREHFTEQDLRTEFDNLVKFGSKKKGITLEKEVNEMSIDELDKVILKYFKKDLTDTTHKPGDFKKDFYRELERLNEVDTSKYKLNENIYELVWQLERECDNPRIRFTAENIKFTPFSDFWGSQHYDPINNIIYLSIRDLKPSLTYSPDFRSFIPEMSHAKQFNTNKIGTILQFISDISSVIKKSKFNLKTFSKEYHKLYSQPGSMEHEAHEIIGPYLEEKYPLFIKKIK